MAKTALLAGATGLIGGHLLDHLLEDPYYTVVKAVTRKKLKEHDKLEQVIVPDFDDLSEHSKELKADDVFCCLGTTIATAKTKEAFFKVDHDYPVALANISEKNEANSFLLVSALGAKTNSRIFYNQVKGKVEESVWTKEFNEVHILRPSLLYGDRDEKRTGESAAKKLYKVLDFIFIGPLKKYKGIHANQVAKAMLHYAKTPYPGKHIHENIELLNI